ncbi:MAG: hypothetical protein PGN25_17895 [Methylorubrum populi]
MQVDWSVWPEPVLRAPSPSGDRSRAADTPPTTATSRTASVAEFKDFITLTDPSIIQPDITRCGGISEAVHIARIARRTDTRLVPHGFSTGILLAATVQFLASQDGCDLIEYSQSSSPLFKDLVTNLIPLDDGQVVVPDTPGLGVKLDEDLIERYRVDVSLDARKRVFIEA